MLVAAMKTKNLRFLAFCATLGIASTTGLPQSSIQSTNNRVVSEVANNMNNTNNDSAFTVGQYTRSVQRQTTVNSNSTSRQQPYVLSVSANTSTQLIGKILVNGVVIHKIHRNKTLINLSLYVIKGRQKIEIIGNYKPAADSIWVKLSGPGTEVAHQTGGDGKLKQTLIIDVQ